MADFRKLLLAFAMVALLAAVGTPAYAQITNAPQFTCTAFASPVNVRAEGLTELVGDITLNCTGGTPTTAGNAIPTTNLTVFLNTNVTSRIMSSSTGGMEALMLIDEPFPASGNVPTTVVTPTNSPVQQYCAAPLTTNCPAVISTGGGVGALGPYSGASAARPNMFQGTQASASSVAWNGVPIEPPGTNLSRIIRITNIRANACALGVSSTLIPTQIVAFISVNGSQFININNPQQTVAFVLVSLTGGTGTGTFLQCNNLNASLISSSLSNGVSTAPITVRATETFPAAFKARSYAPGNGIATGQSASGLQNVPGNVGGYNSESGLVTTATGGSGTGQIGVADTGTRIMFRFNNIGAGISVFAPAQVALVNSSTLAATGGIAQLVTGTDANGNGGSLSTSASTTSTTSVTVTGTSAFVVYEITSSATSITESLRVGVAVAFASNTASNLPAPGQSTFNVSYAPLSTVGTASTSAPIPRFCDTSTPANVFAITACTCDLLFPFVTNQAGFDTGVALANTSLDPFGTVPQAGTTKIFYYGTTTGGGAAPAPQTSLSVPAGSELVFTLSGGGNFGIAATPGFQGYLIAVSNFQFCHAFAYISDIGSQKVAEGYLAIQLDNPVLNRTAQSGENEGH